MKRKHLGWGTAVLLVAAFGLMGMSDATGDPQPAEQKVVYLFEDGSSRLLSGDEEAAGGDRSRILPRLLDDG